MTPENILDRARADGVALALGSSGAVRLRGPTDAVSRWLPVVRGHKDALVSAMQSAASVRWLIRLPDGREMHVTCCPAVTADEVIGKWYPDAISVLPVSPPGPAAVPAWADRELAELLEDERVDPAEVEDIRRDWAELVEAEWRALFRALRA